MGHLIRSRGRERKCRPSAHRKADNRNLVAVKRIDNAREIAGEMGTRILRRVVGSIAMTMATLVVGDDGAAIHQSSPLVKPHALSAGEPMHKDDGLAPAGRAVSKLDVADANAVRGLSHAYLLRVVPVSPSEHDIMMQTAGNALSRP